ncbi:hypothetical protein [Kutzneria chonburiensis]|uniref:Uncharacterized protein n=1 Tax=Kutzneria chonburiensis TaxID=1483604 RepID=A0ABV6N6Y7_9PSEU|nr:hypothetical protein [Kutzneria chonburiensis]
MSTHDRRPDRRTAEEMLDGAPAAGGHPLNALLAVAAAPARDSELAGEHAAVAAFRAARLTSAAQPRRPLLAKLFSAKLAAVVAVLAVAAGGVATAAVIGYLPGPLGGNSHVAPPSRTGDPGSSAVAPPPTSHPTTTEHENGAAPTSGSPSPSLTGLCNAFTAGAGSDHGKALDNPAFSALITAAGGRDKVDAYCADLLAGKQEKGSATPTTTTTTKEKDHGGQGHGPPSTHPDPGPDHPTGPPTTHPGH